MYGHPVALSRWAALHAARRVVLAKMAKARAARRSDRFKAAQIALDLGDNPQPSQPQNALHLRAFFRLDDFRVERSAMEAGSVVIPGKSLMGEIYPLQTPHSGATV